ncbi:MAG: hypothetical protein IKV25_07060 [Clostridia bacterium]|nr:hypothetical protein [Clostridia bacterium]
MISNGKEGVTLQSEITTTIIAAVVGALSGGIVNYLLELRRDKRNDKKEKEKKKEEVHKNRPELDIINYEKHLMADNIKDIPHCDIEVFVSMAERFETGERASAVYDKTDLDREKWHVVTYEFKNMGGTDINSMNLIMSSKRSVCLFETKELDYMIPRGIIKYSVCYDKKIRVGETVSLKLIYNNQRIPVSSISAIMVLGLNDDNGRFWEQPFFAPDEKVYESTQVSSADYHNMLRSDDVYDELEKCR